MAVASANSTGALNDEDEEAAGGTVDAACWRVEEEGTLSGTAAYASGGISISSAVMESSSTIFGLARPTVVLAFATGVL